MAVKTYTPRVCGFQIRDVVYLGRPPKDAPIKYDIVKWKQCEPHEVISLETGEPRIMSEFCYSVGTLEWNAHEPCFEFRSIGLRWLEEDVPGEVIDMILDFCEKKAAEMPDD